MPVNSARWAARSAAQRMKVTGPACTEALSGAEKARGREGAKGNAGGVRVERRVRRWRKHYDY